MAPLIILYSVCGWGHSNNNRQSKGSLAKVGDGYKSVNLCRDWHKELYLLYFICYIENNLCIKCEIKCQKFTSYLIASLTLFTANHYFF